MRDCCVAAFVARITAGQGAMERMAWIARAGRGEEGEAVGGGEGEGAGAGVEGEARGSGGEANFHEL